MPLQHWRLKALTTSLGSLFQGLTILLLKKCFWMSSLNFPRHSSKPFPCITEHQWPSFYLELRDHYSQPGQMSHNSQSSSTAQGARKATNRRVPTERLPSSHSTLSFPHTFNHLFQLSTHPAPCVTAPFKNITLLCPKYFCLFPFSLHQAPWGP